MCLVVASRIYACWFFVSVGFDPVLESDAGVIALFAFVGRPEPFSSRRTKFGRPGLRPGMFWGWAGRRPVDRSFVRLATDFFLSVFDRPGFIRGIVRGCRTKDGRPAVRPFEV